MIPSEILQKVKLIEIRTRRIVNDLFGGEYHSAFKGMGMEFAEVREYTPGDDIRNIDWNVTARTGKPHIKKFEEERELTVMLLVDVSASGYFGTGDSLKTDVMIEIAAVLGFSAIKNNDKVGLLLFSNKIEEFIPPKKGKSHVLRVIRELIYYQAQDRTTNMAAALEHLLETQKRKSVVFLISDFFDKDFEKAINITNRKHDLICIRVLDNAELEIPNLGLVKIHDPELQSSHWIDTGSAKLRSMVKENLTKKMNDFNKFCQKHEVDLISVNTNDGYVDPLVSYMNKRIARY
ncbi:MAG: DUF58 domain-containing protein [Candidatus Marinimicrobia bacterium]|nr:DUF58 domain-containing protein [Candidatus Neomarinimicrobiota bacterium]